jgi:hypothetical protein
MKRYMIPDSLGSARESSIGGWVTASDAEAEIEKARREALTFTAESMAVARAEERESIIKDLESQQGGRGFILAIDRIKSRSGGSQSKPLRKLMYGPTIQVPGIPSDAVILCEADIAAINALVDAVNKLLGM